MPVAEECTPRALAEDLVDILKRRVTGLGLEGNTDECREERAAAEEEVRARGGLGEEERCGECDDPVHKLYSKTTSR